MAAISELIRTEGNGTLSFGDYTLGAKAKLDNYEFHGDKYKVKTFKEITKLERNGLFGRRTDPWRNPCERPCDRDDEEQGNHCIKR